ncbi:MAG: hypothetical protein UR43_C0018G0012, partial [candidate division TM6 bacterium GW2011_GWF2_33_332]
GLVATPTNRYRSPIYFRKFLHLIHSMLKNLCAPLTSWHTPFLASFLPGANIFQNTPKTNFAFSPLSIHKTILLHIAKTLIKQIRRVMRWVVYYYSNSLYVNKYTAIMSKMGISLNPCSFPFNTQFNPN